MMIFFFFLTLFSLKLAKFFKSGGASDTPAMPLISHNLESCNQHKKVFENCCPCINSFIPLMKEPSLLAYIDEMGHSSKTYEASAPNDRNDQVNENLTRGNKINPFIIEL